MISQIKNPTNFISELEKSSVKPDNSVWLKSLRSESATRFNQLGFPTVKDEEWKYTNVAGLAEKKFHFAKSSKLEDIADFREYVAADKITLVFINGFFSKELSQTKNLPKGVTICDIAEADAENQNTIKAYLSKYEQNNEEAFIALNNSFLHHGAFIKVDDKAVIKELIHIVHIVNGQEEDMIVFPRSLIILGKSAEADVLESHLCFSSQNYFTDALTDIFQAENSKLRYYKAQNESINAYHIGTTRIWQERDSQSDSFSFSLGGKLTRNNLWVRLNGEGAGAILNGLYAVTGNQLVDNHTVVDHRPPNCISNQYYKGLLDGNSKAVFNGKIFVRQIAQKTNSYQLNKNLLLGPKCEVNTKPQLEIDADDVRCTHGATIGQLNEDEIFYLESRGITKEKSIKMLSRGFVDEVLNRALHEGARNKMDHLLTKTFQVLG